MEQRKFIQECDFRLLLLRDRAAHLDSRLQHCGVQVAGAQGAVASPTPTPALATAAKAYVNAAKADVNAANAWKKLAGIKTVFRTEREGSGRAVAKGDTVTVHATGVVGESGHKFWSTHDPGQVPFTYQAGVGGVIMGWDQGCLGMRVGETRALRIPADEGYGSGGFPAWGIPGGATLEFMLECLSIV